MFETGARAGEVVALAISDLDLPNGTIVIRRGKGGNGRVVPFGSEAGLAIDRYLRARAGHRLAKSDQMWLGDRGKEFSYYGLRKTLADRAQEAGLVGFHPPQAPPHRRPPLARRRRLGVRFDGRRRLDPARHAAALHQGPGLRPRRRRGPHPPPRRHLTPTRPANADETTVRQGSQLGTSSSARRRAP